ncbi:HipA domain-containing protein [Roseateles terrae]|uniref:Serine/threonine-protein kinase HipA n=1 Tax=Roseateles terrae TaxID=431060 RepID=A0ABR6GV63_9BURK|nr:HipA domain-containing protein [Roseateles terrae]MBB3196001.1 serine/threonine-protein kinase HipA [Roseateles terrae]OWQ85517.1 phosphatidylinositol kinase [Roseateles terrae]
MNSPTGTWTDESSSHALDLWADGRRVATLGYEPLNDRWSLNYDADWVAAPNAFPLSPALALQRATEGYAAGAVKRFVENLLPEGRALDIAARTYRVSKSNVYALISALGTETTGAFRFWPAGEVPPVVAAKPAREVSREELDRRIAERDELPLAIWDGKLRMSIAGVQDKLMVYLDRPLDDGGRLFLVEPPLASTHILKPDPGRQLTPHLVVNEHFCMSLARRMQLPVAEVSIYRTPRPVLVVRRFDRIVQGGGPSGAEPTVRRLHIIDACQASDLPESYKYERNLGGGEHVRHIREGVSFGMLFDRVEQTVNKAVARMTLVRWALFQFLIGNSDAHGKNFSFFVRREGLDPAPWYDLVSVVQYPGIDHELAMAWGDAFSLNEVGAFQVAEFAQRCGIDRKLLQREASRLEKLIVRHAPAQAQADDYVDDGERAFAGKLRDFVMGQATRLARLTSEAAKIKPEFL